MNYIFPEIKKIDDVLPAIKGAQEFTVLHRGPYSVINYQVVKEDTFPSIKSSGGSAKDREKAEHLKKMRRECRGLLFDKDGKIIGRRYHKFFNMNEREETRADQINWDEPHILLEKIDGSMVSPIVMSGKIYWTTKNGITDIAGDVQAFAAKAGIDLNKFIWKWNDDGWNPIFEWVSRKSKVVLDYPEDKLILTAIRDLETGKYLTYTEMAAEAVNHGIPYVKVMDGAKLEDVPGLEDIEGVVVRFESGHMVKVKTAWYSLRHKSKDTITREKGVLQLIFHEEIDDVSAYLTEADQKKIHDFQDNIFNGMMEVSKKMLVDFNKYRKMAGYDRKRFALEIVPTLNGIVAGMMFRMWDIIDLDEQEAFHVLFETLKGHISSTEKIEAVRHLWNYHRWKYYD